MAEPEGYEEVSSEGDTETFGAPADYRVPKRPQRRGQVRLCHACSNVDPQNTDTVCPRCLDELKAIRTLQRQIGAKYPSVLDLSLAAMTRRLYLGFEASRRLVAELLQKGTR